MATLNHDVIIQQAVWMLAASTSTISTSNYSRYREPRPLELLQERKRIHDTQTKFKAQEPFRI